MCEPVSMSTAAYVGMALTAAGYGYSAYTKYQAGQYNAEALRQQGEFTKVMQRTAAARQEWEEQEIARQGHAQEARAKMLAAASGIDPSSGSNLDLQTGIREGFTGDILRSRANLQADLWGYETERWQMEGRARAEKWQGRVGAFSDLLKGAGDTLLMGNQLGLWKKTKVPGQPAVENVFGLDPTFDPFGDKTKKWTKLATRGFRFQ